MHRTYSMRQSRAPTASQLENPLPPVSSAKNRLFGKTSFGENFYLNIDFVFFHCFCFIFLKLGCGKLHSTVNRITRTTDYLDCECWPKKQRQDSDGAPENSSSSQCSLF